MRAVENLGSRSKLRQGEGGVELACGKQAAALQNEAGAAMLRPHEERFIEPKPLDAAEYLDCAGRSFGSAQDRLFASRMEGKIGLLRSE